MDRQQTFREATKLLGGQRETARQLDVSDRSVRAWASGSTPISDGVMRDVEVALARLVEQCELAILELATLTGKKPS